MYAYTQSFIETAFFGQIPVLTKYLTRPFSINQHYCTFEKLCENFSLIVNSACLVAQWDQRELPIPRNLSALCTPNSTQQNNFNSCTDVVWTLPTPRVCECRSDGSGLCHCWEGGDPHTHTTIISVCGNPQLSSPWALFPLLYVVEADCSYLI